jgi:hypothetical protein
MTKNSTTIAAQQHKNKQKNKQQQQHKKQQKIKKKQINKQQQKKNKKAAATAVLLPTQNNSTSIATTSNNNSNNLTAPSPASSLSSSSFLPLPTLSNDKEILADTTISYTSNTEQIYGVQYTTVYNTKNDVPAAAYASANGISSTSNSVKAAHIAGPIIGIFAGIAFIAAAMFLVFRNKRRRSQRLTTNNYNDDDKFYDVPLDDEAIVGTPQDEKKNKADKKKSIISTATTETFVGGSRSNSLSSKHRSWDQKEDETTLVNTKHISNYMMKVAERQQLQHEKPSILNCYNRAAVPQYKAQLADIDVDDVIPPYEVPQLVVTNPIGEEEEIPQQLIITSIVVEEVENKVESVQDIENVVKREAQSTTTVEQVAHKNRKEPGSKFFTKHK